MLYNAMKSIYVKYIFYEILSIVVVINFTKAKHRINPLHLSFTRKTSLYCLSYSSFQYISGFPGILVC